MKERILKSENIISVIISAFNSEETIGVTLASLEQQDCEKNLFEVIVVDDGSRTDATRKIVEEFQKGGIIQILYFFQENKGVGIARNTGVSKSVGKILAFTDADCICDPDWISVIRRSIRDEGKKFIGGYTYSNDTVIFPWKMAPALQTGITANLAIDFTITGGELFDPAFTGMFGDDTDFVLRIEAEGTPLTYVEEMRVLHPPNILSFRRIFIRARGRQNEVYMYKTHREKVWQSFSPVFRPTVFSRISPFSLFFLLSIIGLICTYITTGFKGLILLLLFAGLLFYFFLYQYLVMYNPDNRDITPLERCKTFAYFLCVAPLFIYHRIVGSIRFRFFML